MDHGASVAIDQKTKEETVRRAARAMEVGRLAEAVAILQDLASRVADPQVDIVLSRALSSAGRRDDALAALARATERRPPLPLAFLELGMSLMDLGRLNEAQRVYEDGIGLTGDPTLTLALGYLHLQRGDSADARICFEKVLRQSPARPNAMVGLAKAKVQAGDHGGAADLFRQALALRPQMSPLMLDLARSLLELGEREEAEALLRQVHDASQPAGPILKPLADASHGRMFLRPSDARRFLAS